MHNLLHPTAVCGRHGPGARPPGADQTPSHQAGARQPDRFALAPALAFMLGLGLSACGQSPMQPTATHAAKPPLQTPTQLPAHTAVAAAAPAADPASVPWVDANRLVANLGGHTGHLRPPPAQPAASAATAPGASGAPGSGTAPHAKPAMPAKAPTGTAPGARP